MLTFKDFAPKVLKPPGFLSKGEYGDVTDTVRSADEWMKENGIRPLNVETVLAPVLSLPSRQAPRDSHESAFHTSNLITWFQFIRVWYETK